MQCLHVVSAILRPIRRTDENIAAKWFSRSPLGLGVAEGCLQQLVGKMHPMFGSNAPDDCLRFRKQCL